MFNFTKVPRREFKRHFISNVFMELRYDHKVIDWTSKDPEFKRVAAENLGLDVSRHSMSTEFKLNPLNVNVDAVTQINGLIAQNKDNTFSIQVLSDRIIFSSQKYAGFSAFWTEVERATAFLVPIFEIAIFKWLGVRKVNEILATNDHGLGYTGEGLNRQLISPISDGVFKPDSILTGSSRYELNEETIRCILDTNVRRLNEKEYLLKIDLDFNQDLEGASLASLRDVAKNLNDRLFEVFVWSVSDDVIKSLEA